MAPVIALVVAAVLVGPTAIGRSSAARAARTGPAGANPAGAFTDGGWTLSYVADVQISGPFPGGSTGTGAGAVTGTGVFEVNGGGVSGTHTGAGTAASSITVPGGQTGPAILNLALEGPVAGTIDRTVLQGDVRASGSVSVSTAGLVTTVPVDFDGALGDGAGAPLTTFSVACDRVTGSWAVDLRGDGQPAAGLSVAGPASFVAIRTAQSADSAPAYTRQVTQLLADVDGFVERVGAAPLDVNGLDAIAARAESLSSSLPEVDGCSRASRTSGYSTFLGVEVARLLAATRRQLAAVSTPDLAYLVGLGYRTAAIGTGATWSGAVPLEHALRNELDRRGAAAVRGARHGDGDAGGGRPPAVRRPEPGDRPRQALPRRPGRRGRVAHDPDPRAGGPARARVGARRRRGLVPGRPARPEPPSLLGVAGGFDERAGRRDVEAGSGGCQRTARGQGLDLVGRRVRRVRTAARAQRARAIGP